VTLCVVMRMMLASHLQHELFDGCHHSSAIAELVTEWHCSHACLLTSINTSCMSVDKHKHLLKVSNSSTNLQIVKVDAFFQQCGILWVLDRYKPVLQNLLVPASEQLVLPLLPPSPCSPREVPGQWMPCKPRHLPRRRT
jgi:hypothetical protein